MKSRLCPNGINSTKSTCRGGSIAKGKEVAQQDHYEQIIQELNLKIESLQANNSGTIKAVHASDLLKPDAHDSISTVNTYGVDLVRTVYDTIRHITTETSVLLSLLPNRIK